MSLPNPASLFGDGLRESPLTPEEKAKIETGEMLDAKYSDPDALKQDINGAKSAMGGVGEIAPEVGKEIAQNALTEEEAESGEEEIDFDAAYNGVVGENGDKGMMGNEGIVGEQGNDTLSEENETINISLGIDEDPMSPLVNRLMDGKFIGPEVGIEIKTKLSQGENFEDIISGNELSSPISEQYQQYLIGRSEEIHHSDEELATRNTDSFKNDYSKKLEELGKDKTISEDRVEDIMSQIGQVYLTGGNPEEKEAAFEMAIATAINTEFDTYKTSFHRTVEFEVLFEDVKNHDLSFKERIEAYSDVLNILYTDTGAKGGKRNRENQAMMRKLQLRNSGLQERFETAMEELQKAREANNKEKAKSLLDDIEKIKQETREILDTPIGSFNIALDGEQQQSENPQKSA